MKRLGRSGAITTPAPTFKLPFSNFFIWFVPFIYLLDAWKHRLENRGKFKVTDRSYFDRFISLAVHDRLPLWYLNKFSTWLPVPDFLIHLKITPKEAYKRKKEHPIEFLKREDDLYDSVVWQLPKERIVTIDTMRSDVKTCTEMAKLVLDSLEKFGDPYALAIIQKDTSLLRDNFDAIFEKCWNNRMVFHYFDHVLGIKRMYWEYIEKKAQTLEFIANSGRYKVLRKAFYHDIESDIDVLDKDAWFNFEIPKSQLLLVPIDVHARLEYFGVEFKPDQIGLFHAVLETGTCILRDYTEEMDQFFPKGRFPRKLSLFSMIQIILFYIPFEHQVFAMWNYFKCWRAWRKGKLPYYETEFSKGEIKELVKK